MVAKDGFNVSTTIQAHSFLEKKKDMYMYCTYEASEWDRSSESLSRLHFRVL